MIIFGAALIAFSAFGLIISYATDTTPMNPPLSPIHRAENPKLFDYQTAALWGLGVGGLIVLILGFLLNK